MTINPITNSQEAEVDPELEYRAIINSLKLTTGFGLVFVQCSPSEGERLIEKVKQDLPQKQIQVLSLTEPTDTLYDKVEALYQNQPMDVLFVQGIEHSLFKYERSRLWQDDAQRLNYSETGVPSILQHLNLNREKFQENFPIHFVLLVPRFVLKYFIRRAPDFFDWNSGVFELTMKPGDLLSETLETRFHNFLKDGSENLSPEEGHCNLLKIQALLEEPHQLKEHKIYLLIEQARLFEICYFYEEAIASYDKALHIKSDDHVVWNNRGVALICFGRYEEAIASYNKALKIKPDFHEAWYNRGDTLCSRGRYEEGIFSFDKALQFKPDDYKVWHFRGVALGRLAHHEEAISSYDKALELQPDKHKAWYNRGMALYKLGRHEEAISSFDKAFQIQPDDQNSLYNKACCYALQANLEAALENLNHTIALDLFRSYKYRAMAQTDSDFDAIRDDPRFQALIDPEAAKRLGAFDAL